VNPRHQQRCVYESEEAALAEAGRVFRHLGEVRAYVAELVDSDWWAERWPEVEAIPVARSRSGRMGGYAVDGAGEIRLASLRERSWPSSVIGTSWGGSEDDPDQPEDPDPG
jgi:hypothetical protein